MPRKGQGPRSSPERGGIPSVQRARSLLHDRSVTIEMAGSDGRKPARGRPDPEATRKLIMPSVLDGTDVVRPLPAPRGHGWWRRALRWIGERLRRILAAARSG